MEDSFILFYINRWLKVYQNPTNFTATGVEVRDSAVSEC